MPTLRFPCDLDIDGRVTCLIMGWVAYDPDHKIHMYRSKGNRRAGRAAKYHISKMKDFDFHFTVSAYSDDEALAKANKKLEEIK